MKVRGAEGLSEHLEHGRKDAMLFRTLATLREDVPLKESLDDLEWRGARDGLKQLCHDLGEVELLDRITKWRD